MLYAELLCAITLFHIFAVLLSQHFFFFYQPAAPILRLVYVFQVCLFVVVCASSCNHMYHNYDTYIVAK